MACVACFVHCSCVVVFCALCVLGGLCGVFCGQRGHVGCDHTVIVLIGV